MTDYAYEETDLSGSRIMDPIKHDLIPLWQNMYQHTNNGCAECKSPCCNIEYCEIAREYANSLDQHPDETNNELFYQADNGKCICPPHLRPMCTIHSCKVDKSEVDPEWLGEYWKMRDKLNILIWEQRKLR